MDDLTDRYREKYGVKKKSADREKSIVEGVRSMLGRMSVHEVDGMAVQERYIELDRVVRRGHTSYRECVLYVS